LLEDHNAAVEKFNVEYAKRKIEADKWVKEYLDSKANLPEGDPERIAIRERNKPLYDAYKKWVADELAKLAEMKKAWLDFKAT
jgi:hypothetical protein